MNRSPALCAIAIVASLLSACGRTELSGPPTIRLGQDECAGCGMLVSEDRCSCALLVEEDRGRTHLVFDDMGCLLDYRTKHSECTIIEVFVRDYSARSWLTANTAYFLTRTNDTLTTPMGSGIVAFGSKDAAEAQGKISGGEVMQYEQVENLRREKREARRAEGPP
jgi:copper chaperone NosL